MCGMTKSVEDYDRALSLGLPRNPVEREIMRPVYDVDSGRYIDPRTGREDEHVRRLRLIEESSPGAFWGRDGETS